MLSSSSTLNNQTPKATPLVCKSWKMVNFMAEAMANKGVTQNQVEAHDYTFFLIIQIKEGQNNISFQELVKDLGGTPVHQRQGMFQKLPEFREFCCFLSLKDSHRGNDTVFSGC